jgi:hypothetical protein
VERIGLPSRKARISGDENLVDGLAAALAQQARRTCRLNKAFPVLKLQTLVQMRDQCAVADLLHTSILHAQVFTRRAGSLLEMNGSEARYT